MRALLETPVPSSHNECDMIIHQYPCTKLQDAQSCLLKHSALVCFVLIICTLGLIGNVTVFWLLGFRIKRNFFSVYVLNLAVADFGVLIAVWSMYICAWSSTSDHGTSLPRAYEDLIYMFFFAECSSIFFLTAISVDRCLVIFFPVWHRCRRPKHLSAIVSSVLWGVSCIFLGMMRFSPCGKETNEIVRTGFVIFVSIMVISTVILFFKVCCNSRLQQHGKVHIAILLSLLFFIVTTIPMSLIVYLHKDRNSISPVTLLLTCLNSSINPLIYFIIGIYRSSAQSRISVKDALQWFFKEEEDSGNEAQSSSVMSALYKIRPLRSVLSTQTGSCPLGSPTEELHIT